MPVVVEVPDKDSSRLAKRLIGRRTGVTVVIAGTREAIRASRSSMPDPAMTILVREEGSADPEEIVSLFVSGVRAIVAADPAAMHEDLRDSVDSVRAGFCPLLAETVRDRDRTDGFLQAVREWTTQHLAGVASATDSPLSGGESRILQRISEGATSREIAQEMGFQIQTVKNKVTTIMTKAQARSRTHAVSIAQNNGWIRGSR